MKSITFTKVFQTAINHVNTGRYEGQGVQHISTILAAAGQLPEHEDFLDQVRQSIFEIQSSRAVVYAVNLSDLGDRLVEPNYEEYYQIFWPPQKNIPPRSIVGPERLIARLNL